MCLKRLINLIRDIVGVRAEQLRESMTDPAGSRPVLMMVSLVTVLILIVSVIL